MPKASIIFFFSFFVIISINTQGQTEIADTGRNESIPASAVVQAHKDNLKLTLIIDSFSVGEKTIIPHFRAIIPISFESDYIQIKDSFYLKIFLIRNQEYGKKFYSWKWNYLRKRQNHFISYGYSEYVIMDYNKSISQDGSNGMGIGISGTDEYLMYYYRYKLE